MDNLITNMSISLTRNADRVMPHLTVQMVPSHMGIFLQSTYSHCRYVEGNSSYICTAGVLFHIELASSNIVYSTANNSVYS